MTDINDVTHERQVTDLPKAQALQDAICKAMLAYSDFLADHGLIFKEPDDSDPMKRLCTVERLVAEVRYNGPDWGTGCEIHLVGGALDRAYSDQPTDNEGKPKPSH